MKAPIFVIAQGDQLPDLVVGAENSAGAKQNLAAATGVAAYMMHLSSGSKLTLAATISNTTLGEVTITWGSGDTSVPGLYRLWLVFTFAAGKPMTFPSCPDGPDEVLVEVCAAG